MDNVFFSCSFLMPFHLGEEGANSLQHTSSLFGCLLRPLTSTGSVASEPDLALVPTFGPIAGGSSLTKGSVDGGCHVSGKLLITWSEVIFSVSPMQINRYYPAYEALFCLALSSPSVGGFCCFRTQMLSLFKYKLFHPFHQISCELI